MFSAHSEQRRIYHQQDYNYTRLQYLIRQDHGKFLNFHYFFIYVKSHTKEIRGTCLMSQQNAMCIVFLIFIFMQLYFLPNKALKPMLQPNEKLN